MSYSAKMKEQLEHMNAQMDKASEKLLKLQGAAKKLKLDIKAAEAEVATFNGASQAFTMAQNIVGAAESKASEVEVVDGAACAAE